MAETFTRWYVTKFSKRPEARVFVRETDHYLFDRTGRRHSKVTGWERYYSTEEEAACAIEVREDAAQERVREKRVRDAAPDLLNALCGLIEIGKRDLTNPKYDAFFASARAAIAKAKGGDA